jgi:hypothetical protein
LPFVPISGEDWPDRPFRPWYPSCLLAAALVRFMCGMLKGQ